jgi:2-polyprenyl-6-methoxyphenol hydroxylase-like FAD-dependent oxidoreductase
LQSRTPVLAILYLLNRHEHWKDPVVQNIISKADPGRVYDIMTVPKLPTWGERGIVLIGDSAHPMPPTAGQGVSQDLEDAQTGLILLLSATIAKCHAGEQHGSLIPNAIERSLLLYYYIRHEWVAAHAQWKTTGSVCEILFALGA